MAEPKTVSGAYAKIESHEELCAERYEGIRVSIGDLKSTTNKIVFLTVSCLLALVGWMAAQLWQGHSAPQPAPVSVQAPR